MGTFIGILIVVVGCIALMFTSILRRQTKEIEEAEVFLDDFYRAIGDIPQSTRLKECKFRGDLTDFTIGGD